MQKKFRVKKAFTLIELIIVVLLISLVYYLAFSSFKSKEEKEVKLTIETLKNDLLDNYSYSDSLRFLCIKDEEFPCFILVDNESENMKRVDSFFIKEPNVYNYDNNFSKASFETIRFENFTYDIFFEIKFDKDRKHNNLVVEYEDSIYLIRSISSDILRFNSLSQLDDYKNSLKQKVQYAF